MSDSKKDQIFPAETRRFSLSEAIEQPCRDCSAGCCVYVPLRDFLIRELTELDYARYVLNFDRIELTLHAGGLWRAHYVHPCSNLEPETLRCRVHGSPRQPLTCKSFNAWQCSYKRIYDGPEKGDAIRMDRGRLDHFASLLVFDGYRQIIEAPGMEALSDSLPALAETDWPPARASRVLEQWQREVIRREPEPEVQEYGLQQRPDPCTACESWCCTRLNFPQELPHNVANLEHLRFLSGFPGLELGFGPDGWSLVVRTRCRHRTLESDGSGRCGVFGMPERPIACQSYQGTNCAYKARFGRTRAAHYTRIEYSSLDAVLDLYRVDEDGYIRTHPTSDQVRQVVESDWVRRST